MNIRSLFSIITLSLLTLAVLNSCEGTASTASDTSNVVTAKSSIVFIRLDSISNQYSAFKAKLDELEAKKSLAEKAHGDRVTAFQKDLANLQRRAQSGQMAPKQIGQEQERLAGREQTLMQDAQRISQELELEHYQLLGEFEENLKNVLDEVQAESNYDYILSYGAGTGVLIANNAHDISEEVSKRLNVIPMDGELDSNKEDDTEETTEEETASE